MSDTTATSLEAVPQEALEAVNKGSISWKALAELLTKGRKPVKVERPAVLPVPAEITEKQIEAMRHLLDVFGKVVPTERRALETSEIAALIDERLTLDIIKEMAETRIGHIRTTVLNHMDVEKENAFDKVTEPRPLGGDPIEDALIDKEGHYVPDSKVQAGAPNQEKVFSWERSNLAPDIDLDELRTVAEDEKVPEFTHQDWLAMTEQVRVFNEHRAMTHIKKNPGLLSILQRCAKPGTARGSLYMRKPAK